MGGSDDFPSERVIGVWMEMSGRFGEFGDVFVFTDALLQITWSFTHIISLAAARAVVNNMRMVVFIMNTCLV